MPTVPEPWLRGAIPGVDPSIAPVFYAFQQAREDLAVYVDGLSPAQIWARPYGLGSVGFHIRHIAGSTERLVSYLDGRQLNPEQLAAVKTEEEPGLLTHIAEHTQRHIGQAISAAKLSKAMA